MPLPKSILCTGCKRTYPEGWKRCPYCGHDELRAKLEQQSRRYMEKKVREFEQRTGTGKAGRKEERRDERGGRDRQPQRQRDGRRPQQQ
nr:hypothetical protein [Acidobacteriota bacterium]